MYKYHEALYRNLVQCDNNDHIDHVVIYCIIQYAVLYGLHSICLCVQYYVWGISSKTEQYCIEAQQINHFGVIGPHITNRSSINWKTKVLCVVLHSGYVSRYLCIQMPQFAFISQFI